MLRIQEQRTLSTNLTVNDKFFHLRMEMIRYGTEVQYQTEAGTEGT